MAKRTPPLVRPKRMFKTSAAAFESIRRQTGLTRAQVTPKHTEKAWVWKRKTSRGASTRTSTRTRAASPPRRRKRRISRSAADSAWRFLADLLGL